MKTNVSEKKKSFIYVLFIISSFFLYIVLTGSKNLYVAEKTTLNTLGFGSLTELAMTMEYYFYAYAAMQILLIFFIKKINVKWFLTSTVALSAILTVLVAFTETLTQHNVIYIANGFLQAGIWSCLLKLLSAKLPMRYIALANTLMSAGPAVSGIVSYGTAAAFGDAWRAPFAFLGALLLFAVGLYFYAVGSVDRLPKEIDERIIVKKDGTCEAIKEKEDNDFIHLDSRVRVIVFYLASAVMSFFVTSLFFMLNNNIDVFFKEIGGFSNDHSKLLTIFVPVTIVIGPMLTVNSCEKHKNFILVGAAYFGISAILAFLAVFLFNSHIVISMLILILFLVTVNGARTITLSIVSLKMRKKIDTGVLSATLNSMASIASGVAPRFLATILDNDGFGVVESWRISFISVFALNAFIVVAILLLALWVYLINRKKPQNI